MTTPKILFILRRREDFDPSKHTVIGMQTGLFNSASFVSEMLIADNVESKMVLAIDNNCIDRLVTENKPTHVILEALWVVPSKFHILCKLHPNITWIIRLHSEAPFLSQEGMAFDWLGDYTSFPNIIIAANGPRILNEVRTYLSELRQWSDHETARRVIYLPNYYPQQYHPSNNHPAIDTVNVGCFGAVRPLKNHMVQALAALKFAKTINKKLHFHINARIEGKADSVVSNLKLMFQHLHPRGHRLLFNTWVPREEFLVSCKSMDIGMQVSFSETFNIVGADLVSQGVPFIGSAEIPWLPSCNSEDPGDSDKICAAMLRAYYNAEENVSSNQQSLTTYTTKTRDIWAAYFSQ